LQQIDRTSASDPTHVITQDRYTTAGLLEDINNYVQTTNATTNISHYHYTYDPGNRLKLTTGTDGNKAVDYSNDNQIETVTTSTGTNEAYQFDTLGNRSTWSTDPLDSRRLLNDGTYQYLYDDEGNLSAKTELATGKITTYQWDYRNRLTTVTSSTQTIEYLYDAQDKRVGKKIDGIKIERYIYDGEDIALVVDAQGTLVERYLYGDSTDSVLAVEQNGTISWSLGDRQGSIVDLVDEGGTVLNHFVYDSFGNRTATTGVEFRYGYTGRELDSETGLYYYRARYYAPTTGRFISEDPMGFGAGDTNLYRYVNNSPTNYTDPTGMIGQIAGGAIFGGIAGGLYALANDLETGKFGWNTFGNVVMGAAAGAAVGAIAASGVGLLASGATWAFGTSIAGAVVNTTFVAGSTAYGAYSAGGNFGQGRYLTGTLDLIGVGLGASKVFSDVTKNIPQMYRAEVAARLLNMLDNYPTVQNAPGYQRQVYQVGEPQLNSSGEIVRAGASALANRTSVGAEIVPFGNNAGGALVLANTASSAIVQATQLTAGSTKILPSNIAEETSIVFRVQGGIPPAASRHHVKFKSDGSISISNTTVNISIGDLKHAQHFLQLRPGGKIYSFEIPKWMDDFIEAEKIPQFGAKDNLKSSKLYPQEVDITTPGRSYQLPSVWAKWLEETAINGTGKITE
jgi:RHS repeat-associated protein